MELKLSKPLCFFDLETTGTHIAKDRIVEISILKIYPNGNRESKTWLVNPECTIPAEVIAIHGITNEKVAKEPTFKQLSAQVWQMIKDSDLAGFNSNHFDIPLLAEEMLRAGLDFDLKNTRCIDAKVIFHKMEERTLSAAYKFYCNKNLEDAHSAEADTEATYEVLKAQLDRYPEVLKNDVKNLAEFSHHKKFADFAGFIAFDENGREIFTFGKHKNKLVETVLDTDQGYYSWILNSDFPLYTKKVLTAIKLKTFNQKNKTS